MSIKTSGPPKPVGGDVGTNKLKLRPYGRKEDIRNPTRIKSSYVCPHPKCGFGWALIHEGRSKVKCTNCGTVYKIS